MVHLLELNLCVACCAACAAGMNAPVDEAAEERKGGAGGIAKMLLSAGDSQVRCPRHSSSGTSLGSHA
jgi:hypothetical protein